MHWTRIVLAAALLAGCDGMTSQRYLYTGEVRIEPVAVEALLEQFVRSGCVRLPSAQVSSGCVVGIQEGSSPARLVVYPKGDGCFGPCQFWIDGQKLYAHKDIKGWRDDDDFKDAVRADVRKLGNLVTIVEDTWSVQAQDARGIVY
ncbi:hypothetical protein [Sorangium sp. So ce1099]|uniref:hypothetical protein n=1 Tax=Sorangium sp. So ce1099 TaxID=3133331 RepID=UPI003F5F88B3